MAINIGNRREPLWDYFLIDKERSDATLSVNHPTKGEIVYNFDGPCEGDAYYPTVTRVGDKWRIYYGSGQGAKFLDNGKLDESDVHVCVIESEDGINWTRPVVGKYGENNMILKHPTEPRDTLSVFVDTNPNCPKDRRYKGLVRVEDGCKVVTQGGALACYASSEGLNFERVEDASREPGKFDSLNTAYYDECEDVYKLYHRDFLDGKRAIRYKTSKDFLNWKDEGIITFDDEEKIQLYTNNIKQYNRAPHVQIGFPVRYTERTEWTDNYEQMPDLEYRKSLLDNKDYKRCGLALTDSLFMTSRDGLHWHRFHEAFLAPSEEKPYEWKYGHCYLSHGFVEADNELYFYAVERRRHVGNPIEAPSQLRKYSVRLDGFASFKAPYSGARLVTKPIVFEGGELSINFKTSAAGSIYVKITDEDGNTAKSIEIFGNNVDRRVAFDQPLSSFAGKSVVIEFEMRDAELYSFKSN